MSYHEAMEDIVGYIDENICGELNTETLAACAGFSAYHFSHVFRWCIGYSVMEYVRNRRLAFAAAELSSDRKIIDIAMDFGFETHSGFTKAFKRHFGSPPEVFRKHVYYKVPTRLSLAQMKNYNVGGIVMEPIIKTIPKIKIAGYVIKTKNVDGENSKDIPAFWGAYMSDGRCQKLHGESFVKKHSEYGACFCPDTETGEFDYVIGVEVKDDISIPSEYHTCELPAATYAVFSTPPSDASGFVSAIQGAWQYIFNDWFPSSGYEYAPGCVDFELYDERCMSDTGKVCEIWMPIVKKEG
jgi:AraC family transcriptional regulator